MQKYIFPVNTALLAHAVHEAKERRACSMMESPAEKQWRLGRLRVQQHRSSGSNVRREH